MTCAFPVTERVVLKTGLFLECADSLPGEVVAEGAHRLSGKGRSGGRLVPGDLRFLNLPLLSLRQLMQQIQSRDFPAELEEPDASPLPVSCARESGLKRPPATCASTSVNV